MHTCKQVAFYLQFSFLWITCLTDTYIVTERDEVYCMLQNFSITIPSNLMLILFAFEITIQCIYGY